MSKQDDYLLDSSIKVLGLSANAENALLAAHIYTVGGLISLSPLELQDITALDESLISLIEGILIANNLSLKKNDYSSLHSNGKVPSYLIEQKKLLSKRLIFLENQLGEMRQQLSMIDSQILKLQSKGQASQDINLLREAYDAVLSRRPLKEQAQNLGISITTLKGRASKYRRILFQVQEMELAGIDMDRIAAVLSITPGQAKQIIERLVTLQHDEESATGT
jgi:hypothetical protein